MSFANIWKKGWRRPFVIVACIDRRWRTYHNLDHHASIRTCEAASTKRKCKLRDDCSGRTNDERVGLWQFQGDTHETKNIDTPTPPRPVNTPAAGKVIIPSLKLNKYTDVDMMQLSNIHEMPSNMFSKVPSITAGSDFTTVAGTRLNSFGRVHPASLPRAVRFPTGSGCTCPFPLPSAPATCPFVYDARAASTSPSRCDRSDTGRALLCGLPGVRGNCGMLARCKDGCAAVGVGSESFEASVACRSASASARCARSRDRPDGWKNSDAPRDGSGAAVFVEDSVAVDEDMASVALSGVSADESEADMDGGRPSAAAASAGAGTWRVALGKMKESEECVDKGDFRGRLDSCIVLSRIASWGVNWRENFDWVDM
jgi:hypothetical protein